MNRIEIDKEHEYLDKVLCLMKHQVAEINEKLDNKKTDIIESRREMFDNTTNVIRDFDDVIELNIQNNVIQEKTDDYQMLLEKQKKLLELLVTPYYGRFDYKDNNSKEYRSFYIGKYSFYDSNLLNYYIYDWRAPISSLFYDYDIGEASFETPNGVRHGNINLKRQYEISKGIIGYMNDTEAIAQDEIFTKVLAENTSKNLKVIISSIQKEQNKAIRYMKSENLLIFGPAGSGKTSVGLHRLAYILYHKRDEMSSSNVAVISNNNIFDSYISNIIPELGEDGVNRLIFSSMIRPYVPEGYKEINYYEQVNFLMNTEEKDVRVKGIEIKGSNNFLEYIKKYLSNIKLNLYGLTYNRKTVCKKQELEILFNSDQGQSSLKSRITRINYFIESQYEDYFLLNKKDIKQKIKEKSEEFLSETEIDIVYQSHLKEGIIKANKRIVKSNNLDEISLYRIILKSYLLDENMDTEIYKNTNQNLSIKILYHEDCMAVLCIKALLNNISTDNSIKHVLIDEAQDYSLLQLFFIKGLFSNSQFTILADTNQAIHPFISTNNELDFNKIFKDKTQKLYLDKSYRSTGAINKLAFNLLESNKDIKYFNRSGETPSYIISNNISESILKIIAKDSLRDNLIGILVKTKQQAEKTYKALKDKIDIQLIINPSDKLQKNIIILPVILAKGLEFDTVIADISSKEQNSYDKNILYLMCSRALHNLYLIGPEELPQTFKNRSTLLKVVTDE